MAQTFQKKPKQVEAMQWDGGNESEMSEFVGSIDHAFDYTQDPAPLKLFQHGFDNPPQVVMVGDWVVKYPTGEFSMCPGKWFESHWEAVD